MNAFSSRQRKIRRALKDDEPFLPSPDSILPYVGLAGATAAIRRLAIIRDAQLLDALVLTSESRKLRLRSGVGV